MKNVRLITLVGATGVIRSAKFEDRDYIVVPVVALVEGVIQAMNAAAPEMVLAEEFSKVPSGWNGRPVMADHPIRNGAPVSANHPEVLEAESVGLVFNAKVVGKKLTMEAWIDVAKAKKTEKGLSLLARAEQGLPIEVSVGVFVTSESAPGVFDGKQFFTVWRDIVPDHLALLSEGSTGACSMEMGCGVRAAAKNQLTDEGVNIVAEPATPPSNKTFRERIAALFGFKTNEGLTANELHNQLWDALYASEPGFAGIDDILLDESAVVYSTSPEQKGYKTYRRSYSKSDDGSLNLAEDRVEVRRKSSWEPVAAGSAPCGCGKGNVTVNEENKTMQVEKQAERIKALCDSKKNSFTEELHGTFLRTLGENELKALEDIDAKTSEPKAETPKVETPAVASAPKTEEPKAPVTVESYIASAPAEIQQVLSAGIRAAKAEKDAIIAQLKTSKSNPFTDAQLNAKDVEELRQLLQFAGIAAPATNYAVQGTPRTAETKREETEHADAPPDMVAILQAKK